MQFALLHHSLTRYRGFVTGNPAFIEEIHATIAANGGRITFAQFMELALYHPQHGYYRSGKPRIGKDGDYFTSASVGPLFGRILARHFQQLRQEMGNPPEFEIVEFGGHTGQLRADVLSAAPSLPYRIVEAGQTPPDDITGIAFSNELLDALPIHRVQVLNGRWVELYVTVKGETTGPLSDPRLTGYLTGLPVELMEGYRTEVNLRALDWLADVARRLRRGYIITIDYGWERNDYFAPHRHEGHLQCYYRHTKSGNPYEHVGEQDITAHIEFTILTERGRQLGLETVLFTDQAHYLLQVGESEISQIVTETAGQFSKVRAAIQQLIHPGHMGHAFKVLVQRRLPTFDT